MPVCSKFMRVRSLWKLRARAHEHSLVGTLFESIFYMFLVIDSPASDSQRKFVFGCSFSMFDL